MGGQGGVHGRAILGTEAAKLVRCNNAAGSRTLASPLCLLTLRGHLAPIYIRRHLCTYNPALYEVLYVSTIAPDQPLSVVAEIAGRARVVNAELGITGLLIFDGQRFCQQLEGPAKSGAQTHRAHPQRPATSTSRCCTTAPWQGGDFSTSAWHSAPWKTWTLARMELLDGEAALAGFEALRGQLVL